MNGERMIHLYALLASGAPKPGDLAEDEDAFWDRAERRIAEAVAKGLTIDVPHEIAKPLPADIKKAEQE